MSQVSGRFVKPRIIKNGIKNKTIRVVTLDPDPQEIAKGEAGHGIGVKLLIEAYQAAGFEGRVIADVINRGFDGLPLKGKELSAAVGELQQRVIVNGDQVVLLVGGNCQSACGITHDFLSNNARISRFLPKVAAVRCVHPEYLHENRWAGVDLRQAVRASVSCIDGWVYKTSRLQPKQMQAWLHHSQNQWVGLDIETSSLNPRDGKIITISCSLGPKNTVWCEWCPSLAKFLRNTKAIMHNAPFECEWFESQDIRLAGYRDTLVRHWLFDEFRSQGLDRIASVFLNMKPYWLDIDVTNLVNLPLEMVGYYNSGDSLASWSLENEGHLPLASDQQTLYERCCEMTPILARMKMRGIRISQSRIKALRAELDKEIASHRRKLDRKFPNTNWNSPKQVAEIVYDQLGLPCKERTAGGERSTSEEALSKLDHPLTKSMITISIKTRKINQVVAPLIDLSEADGFVHGTLRFGRVPTGRLSSIDPNMQNLDRDGPERKCFVSRWADGWLVQGDYKHFEMRGCAWQSGDKEMLRIFNEELDPHEIVGERMKIGRQGGKRCNFSLITGISPQGLTRDHGFPLKLSRKYHEQWHAIFKDVQPWHSNVRNLARKQGYVVGPCGRRRHLPDIWSSNPALAARAGRQAISHTLQSMVDISYFAMVEIEREIEERDLQGRAMMVLQVHDSIVADCRRGVVDEVKEIMTQCMTQAFRTPVKLGVDFKVQKTL